MRLAASLLCAVAVVGCGGSGSADPPEQRASALRVLDTAPLLGVLVADCTETSADEFDDEFDDNGEALGSPMNLFELPPAGSVFGGEISQFLLVLELHGDELPIVAGLTSSIEDPTIAIPLPLEDAFALLPGTEVPSDTPVLGSTTLGCSGEEGAPPFGLVPLFEGVQ